MIRLIDSARHPLARGAYRYVVVGALTAAGLSACSTSPLGPNDASASMRVGATTMNATTLGQTITIDAAVVAASGTRIPDAEIHWELSSPGVLELMGDGRFRVMHEGSVQVAAVWPRDPSVRALVTVKVNASILASACVARSDQALGKAAKCAERRMVVSVAPAATTIASASSAKVQPRRGQP